MNKLNLTHVTKRGLKALLPSRVKVWLRPQEDIFCHKSYAQEGEDLILASLFRLADKPQTGFYVDVGAHHPRRYSNTYYFYQRGWRGVNIDAMPGSMRPFSAERPNDINLEVAVSNKQETLTYYKFNEPAMNGFSKCVSHERDGQEGFKLISEQKITAQPLSQILDKHLPQDQAIDFMSVDVEGLDLEVLMSNDWERYRPRLVLVEDYEIMRLSDSASSAIVSFMSHQGYLPYCKTPLTTFFVENNQFSIGPLGFHLKAYSAQSS